AVNAGNTEIATLLLNAGANMGATWDQDEHQPLHMAAMNKDLQMMKLLLDRGAPVDTLFGCHGYRENALHYASSIGHMGMVNLLLERGANVE
ncbi:ankyrin repeat-containing domain protein, partial [Mycena galopus ATCC 62051]